jgi:hypothetical protein
MCSRLMNIFVVFIYLFVQCFCVFLKFYINLSVNKTKDWKYLLFNKDISPLIMLTKTLNCFLSRTILKWLFLTMQTHYKYVEFHWETNSLFHSFWKKEIYVLNIYLIFVVSVLFFGYHIMKFSNMNWLLSITLWFIFSSSNFVKATWWSCTIASPRVLKKQIINLTALLIKHLNYIKKLFLISR